MSGLHNLKPERVVRAFERAGWRVEGQRGSHVEVPKKAVLHFMHYNFCRIHQSLRVTPAMAAGVTDHVWEIEEILSQLP